MTLQIGIGPHLCGAFRRIESPGKQKRHLKKCATCRQAALLTMHERRQATAQDQARAGLGAKPAGSGVVCQHGTPVETECPACSDPRGG